MPLISVVVPVYNTNKYIRRCIDSILSQSFSDFELIVVDDGSPDNCGEICDQYSEKDKRVRVLHQDNAGVSAARNNGVKIAKGDYITFIDSDDWVDQNFLQRMYSVCESNNAQMCICKLKMLDNERSDQTEINPTEIMSGREAIEKHGYIMDYRFRGPYVKLIKRDIVLAHPFPLGRKYGEDAACVYLWMWDCNTIAELDEVYYYYFQHEDSCVHEEFNWKRLDNFFTYDELLDFYKKQQMNGLYEFTLQKYICEILSDFEISKIFDKKDITVYIEKKINEVLCIHLGYQDSDKIEKREDVIEIYKRRSNKKTTQLYINECARTISMHVNYFASIGNIDISIEFKKRLKKLLIKHRPDIKECYWSYEIVYPKLINGYWRLLSIKHRIGKMKK